MKKDGIFDRMNRIYRMRNGKRWVLYPAWSTLTASLRKRIYKHTLEVADAWAE